MNSIPLWISGENGYKTYRIPALAVCNSGALLAFCEGRRDGRGDTGKIDLLVRRSTDGGDTWSDPLVVWGDADNVCGNPAPVVDRTTGTVWLLSTWNRGCDEEHEIIEGTSQDTRRVFVLSSPDEGQTWSEAHEITSTTKSPEWSWYATGPGAGIQLQHGSHAGRLMVACDRWDNPERIYRSHVIYSDDHGQSWQLGGSAPRLGVNECTVVELADGRLRLNMRNGYRGIRQRQEALSDDGGETWRDQFVRPDLIEPICQASIRRGPSTPEGKATLLFANPASTDERAHLTVRASLDEGDTWPMSKVLQPGPSAYTDLAVLPDGRIACFYETGVEHPYEKLELVLLTWEELAAGGC